MYGKKHSNLTNKIKEFSFNRIEFFINQTVIALIIFLFNNKLISLQQIKNDDIHILIFFYMFMCLLSIINSIGRLNNLKLSKLYSILILIPIINIIFILFLTFKKSNYLK